LGIVATVGILVDSLGGAVRKFLNKGSKKRQNNFSLFFLSEHVKTQYSKRQS